MPYNNRKNRKISFIILFVLLLGLFIIDPNSIRNPYHIEKSGNGNRTSNDFDDKFLKTQDLSSDNVYSGIGSPWNVTHWANRTDNDLMGRLNEGSYDIVEIPLEDGWEGYYLDAGIKNLYDTRNWCNGTFAFGPQIDGVVAGHNDSDNTILSNNKFQNWTFHSYDNNTSPAVTNVMSGNYINSGSLDYLELYMESSTRPLYGVDWDGYDKEDICMWNSSFYIERGNVINSTLEFDVYTEHLANINVFALTVYINNEKIYSKGTYDLEMEAGGEDRWHHVVWSQSKWKNESNVFSGIVNNSKVEISIALESLGSNMRIGDPGTYQTLYIDNLTLNSRAEVKPYQIGLKLNSTDVITTDWGSGSRKFDAKGNEWQSVNNKAHVNFSSTDTWDLSEFTIDLKMDSNFFAMKNALETTYEAKQTSIGTSFEVENDSVVNWVSYVYIQVPQGYLQNNLSIQFSRDINLTGVYAPQSPSENIINKCDRTTRGLLIINISEISLTPDGFWKFEGKSPNYCEDLNIFVEESGSWVKNSTIVSGDKINFRANITTANSFVDISDYIESTTAQLQIRFPNGTIWSEQNQFVKPDQNGIVNFSYFEVPNTISPNYIAGEYEAIVSWNNSYSSFGINKTGIFTKKFIIQHDSILKPEDTDYYIENIAFGTIINIRVSFKDKIDNTYISKAEVYALDPSESKLSFSEISPGFYLYEFNTSSVSSGNITLRTFANSSYYLNKQINITVDVIEGTILLVDNDFLTDVQYNQNFTIQFNYTRKDDPSSEISIDENNEFLTDWMASYHVVQNGDDTYNLTCNTTGYAPNIIHSFTFTVDAYKFESQTKEINVLINELDSKIEIFVNNTPFFTNDILNVEVWQKINITTRYLDVNNVLITDGTVRVIGRDGLEKNLTYIPQNNHYNIILNVTDLAEGLDYLNIIGESVNHRSSSIPFIVQITENKTLMEIYFNGVNVTGDPNIELVYGSKLNITIKYTNIFGVPLESASLTLSGDYSGNLLENITSKQYTITLDVKNFSIGVKTIRLNAEKNNFETQVEDLRVVVRKIKTEVSIVDEDDKIEIKPGESVSLTVEVLDLDNNVRIRGVLVEYEWKLKDGEFDEESNGLYEVDLKDIPEGSYVITIIISKEGDQYNFETVEITLVVRESQEETFLLQILLIVAIIFAGALVAYIIYYQKVLKYPKPVRKVRKFRRTLKKKKAPRVDIINREKAFNLLYDQQLKNISGPLKSKILEGKPISKINKKLEASKPSEKIIKKLPNNGSDKKINKTPKSLPSKKAEKLKESLPNSEYSKKNNNLFENKDRNSFRKHQNKKLYRKKFNFKNKHINRFQLKRYKRLFFLSLILLFLTINSFIINLNNNQKSYILNQSKDEENSFLEDDLKSQDLVFYDNIFNNSGIGTPWNITYFANSTNTGTASFSNNENQILTIQSATGWMGYKLNASVRDLYDNRQWVNGSMHYGDGDGHDNIGEDDTNDIQDWSFYRAGYADNPMSGNYINDTSAISDGHDCLELRMEGDHHTGLGGDRWSYDGGDQCGWVYTVDIPRGRVLDSKFSFDIKPVYIAQSLNAWAVVVYINGQEVLRYDIIDLNDIGEGNWYHREFTQEAWSNSDVFPDPLESSTTEIDIRLEYTASGYSHGGEDGTHIDYQQVLIDNVELEIQAEAYPTQVNLEMNNTAVQNGTNYGEGTVEITGGNWNGTEIPYVKANFSSQGIGDYGGYDLDFTADSNLYVKKDTPESYFEQDTGSLGSYFTVNNNTIVNWETYGYINTPTNYEVTDTIVEYPSDYNLYWVSSPLQPESDVSSSCEYLSNGIIIPTSQISSPSKPDGFWKLKATSPNYFEELNILRNGTANPNDNVWISDTIFYSGDYINITAKISAPPLISNHIALTKAQLQIRFPNGSIWNDVNRLGNVDNNGNIKFDYIRISPNPPNYEAGKYEAIITWNNSFSYRGNNETGVIYKNFIVLHDSILNSADGKNYIENVVDDSMINVKVEFKDIIDNTAIENAHVYTKNASNHILNFSEISPGVYLYEYDTQKTQAGNNTLRIYGNSTYYQNNEINITIDVTKQTILNVDNDYISVPFNSNFSVLFNYTEFNSPEIGINTTEISTNWIDDFTITRMSQGRYNFTANTSAYQSNKLHTLLLTVKAYKHESKSIPIRVYVSELGSSLILFVNNTVFTESDIYTTEVWQKINITVKYEDTSGNHLSGANITLLDKGEFKEQGSLEQYSIIIDATTLSEDIDTLTIIANKSQYNPQTTQFIAEITERQTNIEIWINNVNSTKDPAVIIPIGQSLNLKINYTDSSYAHVENATVKLIGEGYNVLLNEDKSIGLYSSTISTIQLELGTQTLTIDASKNNYKPIIKNMRVIVRKIRTEVTTEDEKKKYEISQGENFKLTIELKNLDFGGKIEDADVTFDWEFGEGDLEEISDGVYEITFENVPEGSYTIKISAFKEGGEYEFDDLKITLVARRPEGEALLFLILLISAIAIFAALASYFIYYKRVLRFPKPVRKVRKYRRSLKKKNAPNIDIISREKAFNNLFTEELGKTSKSLKGRVLEETSVSGKIVKKPLKTLKNEIVKKKSTNSLQKKSKE